MIALSTSWFPRNDPRLVAALEAIHKMGFQAVEIGIAADGFNLKKARKCLERVPLKVVSVHNVCTERTLDRENRRGDWLASTDEKKRREGVRATLESAQNAKALGASAVVLHLGALPIEERWEKQKLFERLRREGDAAPRDVVRAADRCLAERARRAPAHIEAACRSLAELLEKTSAVKFGIECRLGWHELPNLAELSLLLRRFPDPRVGYWHDVGHAVVLDALGFGSHLEWLLRHRDRTVGIHLHDVQERLRDHYPPGLGQVDFRRLARLVPRGALRVMEVSANFIAEEVVLGRKRLEEMGF